MPGEKEPEATGDSAAPPTTSTAAPEPSEAQQTTDAKAEEKTKPEEDQKKGEGEKEGGKEGGKKEDDKKDEQKEDDKKDEQKADGKKDELKGDEKAKEQKEDEKKEEEKRMKSVLLVGFGGTRMMKCVHIRQPTPAEGHVLIRVKTCGMSFQDLVTRQGILDDPPRTPLVLGSECAGVVEALGPNTSGFTAGDRVIALTDYKAWAELVQVPARHVYRLPDSVSFQEGVCLLTHYVTAYVLLFELANLRQGHSLLLHSAGGGVGLAILQLCATVGGVTVFGTASPHKHDKLKDKVTHLFPHNVDYVQEIRKVSPAGVDIVLDCLCGDDTNRGISLLKPLGKYILYGSGNMVTGETKSLFSFAKSWWQVDKVSPLRLGDHNRTIGGFHLRHLLFQQGQHDYVRSVVDKLLGLHAQGRITPVIDSVWAFEDVGAGMQKLQDRLNIGKVLLDPSKQPVSKEVESKAAAAAEEEAEAVGESGEEEKDQKAETPAADTQ